MIVYQWLVACIVFRRVRQNYLGLNIRYILITFKGIPTPDTLTRNSTTWPNPPFYLRSSKFLGHWLERVADSRPEGQLGSWDFFRAWIGVFREIKEIERAWRIPIVQVRFRFEILNRMVIYQWPVAGIFQKSPTELFKWAQGFELNLRCALPHEPIRYNPCDMG